MKCLFIKQILKPQKARRRRRKDDSIFLRNMIGCYKGAHQTVMCWGQCHLIIDFIFKILSSTKERIFYFNASCNNRSIKVRSILPYIQRQMYQIDRTRSWIEDQKKEKKKSKKEIFKTNKKKINNTKMKKINIIYKTFDRCNTLF